MREVNAGNGEDTFPKLLLRNAKVRGGLPAMREKDLGIWQTWSWEEVADEVRAFALGLRSLGLLEGDRVAIVGNNRPRLYFAIAAIQSLRAVPVPIYQDAVAEEMLFVLDHAEVRFAVVEDQEQVDKLLSISERLPRLEHILYDQTRGLSTYDHGQLHAVEEVETEGRAIAERDPAAVRALDESIAAGTGADLGVILYTSGTTGQPKGVMLSFDNLVVSARNGCAFDNLTEKDEILAYLPMAWVGDHVFSYCQSYYAGFCIACPESPETMMQNLKEIGPTFFFAPPRIYENTLTAVTIRMQDASRVKRWIYDYFLGLARRVGEPILNGESVSLKDRLLYALGTALIYAPLKNALGFSRIRVGYTAGEAIGPEIFRFYRSLGMNLKQLYGQTEASVFITMQPDGEIRADTVGRPGPEVEIQVADSGEVLYRSPGVFVGYYRNDEATAATKTQDGWVHTGDAGFFDTEGHLRIIDRAKDVGRLTDGSLFAPKYIENKLKFFPNIKEAVAFGHERDHVAVFVNMDLSAVGSWAERNNVSFASYQELAAMPEVYDMIQAHVEAVNRDLAAEPRMARSQIRRFLVLHKELDADDGELTRTQKVRRSFIAEKFGPLIEALYDGAREAEITTQVTYEDGRKGMMTARVQIRDVDIAPVEAMPEAAE